MSNQILKALGNEEIWIVLFNTFKVTGLATLLALAAGVPLAFILAYKRFPFKKLMMAILNTGMGLPPVIVGLFVSMVFWRSGIFGYMNLLYTPTAMIIAEFIISLPIVTSLSFAALQSVGQEIIDQFHALGANRFQLTISIIRESRLTVTAAVIAGYGAIVSEVGAALMVGGNIKNETRVLTTAIVLETRKGNFEFALALGIILLILAFVVNSYLTWIQQKEEAWQKKA